MYPGEFLLHAKWNHLLWVPVNGRRQVLDATLNVFFYIPLGAAGFLSVRRGWLGWLATIVCGALFSWLIEWLQLWTPARVGSVTDILSNSAGTLVGATGAYLAIKSGWDSPGVLKTSPLPRWRLHMTGVLLMGLWVLWQGFPFIPALSLLRLTRFVDFIAPWEWRTMAEALLGFWVLRLVVGRSPWLWVAYAALPAQAFLVERALSFAVILGAALGWGIAKFVPANGTLLLRWVLPICLALEELRPFVLTGEPNPFGWAPFQSWFETASSTYYPVIFGKLFLYVGVIWVLREQRLRWRWAIGIPATILGTGEWAQRYLVGRTPESTDLVLLAAGAVLLALCAPRAENQKTVATGCTQR